MRWFKHISAARRDEKLAAYMDECKRPLEAIGFWWMLLEVIAEQMNKDDEKCAVTYALPRWSRELYCHHHTVSNYMGKLQGNGLVTLTRKGSSLTVEIPNLLKYRDEYSRKSGQSPDRLRSKKQIQNIDTNLDTDSGGASGAHSVGQNDKQKLWKLGAEVLGDTDANRSLIGKTLKNHSLAPVRDALEATRAQAPVDPKAYFLRVLRGRGLTEKQRAEAEAEEQRRVAAAEERAEQELEELLEQQRQQH